MRSKTVDIGQHTRRSQNDPLARQKGGNLKLEVRCFYVLSLSDLSNVHYKISHAQFLGLHRGASHGFKPYRPEFRI